MRSAERITRTPAEWHDYQAAERQRVLELVLRELRAAAAAAAPWYEWVRARAEHRHLHGLKDAEGRPVACPFPGCHEHAALQPARLSTPAAPATVPAGPDEQLRLA